MEDIFLRKEAFEDEPWYGQLLIFLAIGVCTVEQEHVESIQKALDRLGYVTKTRDKDGTGCIYVIGVQE